LCVAPLEMDCHRN